MISVLLGCYANQILVNSTFSNSFLPLHTDQFLAISEIGSRLANVKRKICIMSGTFCLVSEEEPQTVFRA